jgi:precorrin-6B methylase 2
VCEGLLVSVKGILIMVTNNIFNRLFIAYILTAFSVTLFSQGKTGTENVQPVEGQEGKNVPWITTPQVLVDKMLELAEITPADYLIDLGSGDGRTVISAAKRGTRALGIEYNPDLVTLSQKNAEKEGVKEMARFIKADIFEYDFSKASVITMFLLPEINMRLRSRLLRLKPGTRIVTNTFTMQEWQYDGIAKTGDEKNRWNTAYLWIVPAKVDGKWTLSQGGELFFIQEFQMIKGSLTTGNNKAAITDGRLTGNKIVFKAGGDYYSGVINGNRMEGTVSSGGSSKKWSATR